MINVIKVFIFFIIFLLAFISPVRYHAGDSRFTLLTAQAILQNHTLALDNYCEKINCNNGRLIKDGKHYYYYFPLGNSLVSLPFVYVANMFNYDMTDRYDEYKIQEFLVGVCCCLIFLMLLKISGLFYNEKISLIISCVFFFSTLLSSTLLSALWSHNFAVLFSFCVVYMLLTKPKNYILLSAIFLILGYMCRPTVSLFFIFSFLFILRYSVYNALKLAFYYFIFFAAFYLLCSCYFSTGLPPYYLPSRLHNDDIITALLGNTVSPSRGLFVFMPFLATMFLFKIRNTFKDWWILGIGWPILHIVSVCTYPVWWGQMSFGPRLLVDCMPGIFILFLNFWPNFNENKIKIFIFFTAIFISVYLNSYVGRFRIDSAITWNHYHLEGNELQTDRKVFFLWSEAQWKY